MDGSLSGGPSFFASMDMKIDEDRILHHAAKEIARAGSARAVDAAVERIVGPVRAGLSAEALSIVESLKVVRMRELSGQSVFRKAACGRRRHGGVDRGSDGA